MNEIRLKAYGFSMEAVGSKKKKFIAQEREAFLDFTEEKVSKAAMKLSGNDARAEVHSQEVRNRENAEHGEDLVTMTHKTTQPISLEWIQEVVRLGRARDYFSEGDTIDIEFDGEVIQHDIIGIDAEKLVDKSLEHSITIQMHDLVMEERPFDTTGDYGSNVWETSELRKYLHSEEFRERYKKLIPYLTKVVKENNSGDDTEDLFFLLSADEVDPKKTPYKYYEDVTNRQKKNADGETDYHRLRSAIVAIRTVRGTCTLAATSATTTRTGPFAAPRLVPLHNHIIPAPADAGKKKERKEHGRNTEYQH